MYGIQIALVTRLLVNSKEKYVEERILKYSSQMAHGNLLQSFLAIIEITEQMVHGKCIKGKL